MKSDFGALGFGPYAVSQLPITVLYGYGVALYAFQQCCHHHCPSRRPYTVRTHYLRLDCFCLVFYPKESLHYRCRHVKFYLYFNDPDGTTVADTSASLLGPLPAK